MLAQNSSGIQIGAGDREWGDASALLALAAESPQFRVAFVFQRATDDGVLSTGHRRLASPRFLPSQVPRDP
jgi:hypothetical protein